MKLEPRDAAWVYLEQANTPLLSIAMYVFDTSTDPRGSMTPDEVRAFVAERVQTVDVFTRRLQRVPFDLDHPSWVEDHDFDVDNHLAVTDARGGGWREFRRIASEFVGSGLDLQRPPWEMRVVTGLADIDGVADASAVLLKFHHSVGDGTVTLEMTRRLFAAEVDPRLISVPQTPPGPRSVRQALPTVSRQLRAFVRGIRHVSAAGKEVKAAVDSGDVRVPPRTRPATRFNRTVGPARVFDAASFLLDDVREIRAAAGDVTVNDVALTVVAGALRDYLREVGEEPAESLGAKVPMSIRSLGQLESANQLTVLQVDLRTDIADPLARLRAIHDSAAAERDRKQRSEVLRSESLVDVTPGFVVRPISWIAARLPTPSETVPYFNVGTTNVARGGEDLWLRDAHAVSTYGAAALSERQGLTHAVHSLGNTLTISVLTDPDMMADPDHYVALLRAQFDSLAAALGASTSTV
ncbi:MAG: wax ester/triacylglycerol synthase family O-acyltransferase [Rhodococcus sp. (in: high G+C Gram-positive bacteria)]|nr:MAG: wax ester/triacylglycerol synthase family O-acyltransferase [Rhodococcus sp. (in: high G+C Gram-positive bacteria)]